jgi:WD40 repeat protein
VAVHPDGGAVATVGSEGVIRLHDARSGQLTGALRTKGEPIVGLSFAPDGRLASFDTSHVMRIWDVKTGKQIVESALPTTPQQARSAAYLRHAPVAWTDNGEFVACALGTEVVVWDAATGRVWNEKLPATGRGLKGLRLYVQAISTRGA